MVSSTALGVIRPMSAFHVSGQSALVRITSADWYWSYFTRLNLARSYACSRHPVSRIMPLYPMMVVVCLVSLCVMA